MKAVGNPITLDGIRVINDTELLVNTLKEGETVAHWEYGDSMIPLLISGQYVRLEPIHETPHNGDIVYCLVDGEWMCHMVWVVNRFTKQCLIGSTSGELYGWADEVIAIGKPMPYTVE